jgi:tryptophan-rich sensory protein
MKIAYSRLIPSLIFPLVIGFSGATLTMEGVNNYYIFLNKPPLTPPSWVFGPVWTCLYILLGLSLYLFWNTPKPLKSKIYGFKFYILQMLANFMWSLLFFNMQSPAWALVDIILMIVLTVGNFYFFQKVNKSSAWLLVPYLIWISFATFLNAAILVLNPAI